MGNKERTVDEMYNAIPIDPDKKTSSFYEVWMLDDGSVAVFDDREQEVGHYPSMEDAKKEWTIF